MLLCVGHYQRAFLTATERAACKADKQQKLREFHSAQYTRAAASRNFCQRLPVEHVNQRGGFMRLLNALGAVMAIAACGASGAAFADNPVGFYVGAGVGESQIRSDDSRYGYPGYYDDYQFAWQGIVGIRPLPMLGLEAAYIDFGQPHRHNGYYDFNVSGSDSHPTAPALFAVGYLPLPLPFIDVFAKAGAARLSTNLTDFVQQPCPANGPCPYFIPTDRHQVTDTRFAYGAGVQSKFPFGLTLRGEYERISSQYGDPDALMVSALWQF
jgi:opacity protein-like surface antigen